MKPKLVPVAVAVVIDTERRVLLTRRHAPEDRNWHNKWQLPGGQIEIGEHPTTAAIRETKEEVNLEVELTSKIPSSFSTIFEPQNIHVLLLGYPAKIISGILDFSQDEYTNGAKWYHFHEIDMLECLPHTKEIVEDALKKIN